MPILQGIKRINPLDLNKNVKIGVAFPLDDINMFKGTETIKEQAKTNLINLLLTNRGERPMLPKYGIGLKKLLFENEINTELLIEKIRIQTFRYIQEISIQDVQITTSEDKHTIFITIVYSIISDQSIDSIQLNFA
jgi:phage baseplate assembly protein W